MSAPRQLTDAEVRHAERHGWRVSRMGAESTPRPQMTAHLYVGYAMTACGLDKVMRVSAPAGERDIACRDCVDAIDPAAQAALVDDEVPFR